MSTQEQAEQIQAQINTEMRELLETRGGRYLFWQLLQLTEFFIPVQSMTPEAACYNEGKRDVGARVLDLLFTHAPETFMLMREEGQERDAALGSLTQQEDEDDG